MKKKLDALYFGVKLYPLSYSSDQERELATYNLFDFARVKWSVAKYITMTDIERQNVSNPLMFCFGDVWSRCEFEFVVCPWGGTEEDAKITEVGTKVDIYKMYVEPNAEYLMELISSVSQSSAKAYLREERKRLKR